VDPDAGDAPNVRPRRAGALAAGTVGDGAAADDVDAEALEERIDDLKDKLLRQTAELARTRQYLALCVTRAVRL